MAPSEESDAAITMPEGNNAPKQQDSSTQPRRRLCKRTKDEYKDRLTDALASSTIMGVSQAFGKNKLVYKLFWFAVFMFGVIAFIVNMYHITKNYLKKPILTQLERDPPDFMWPDFTFCNPANPIPFWVDKTYERKWKEVFKKAETEYTLPKYNTSKGGKKKIWEHYMGISTINPRDFYKDLLYASFQKVQYVFEDESIAGFSSALDQYKNVEGKELENIFEVRLDTIRSPIPCLTLRPKKLQESRSVGKGHKLISIKLYTIMDLYSYKFFNMGFETRKMYFFISEANGTILSKFPYYVVPGTDSTFLLSEKIHNRVADCTEKQFKVELFDMTMSKTREFKGGFDDCRTYISQKRFIAKCKCYNPYLPIYKFPDQEPVLCTNMSRFDNKTMFEKVECLNEVYKQNSHSTDFYKEMKKTCYEYKIDPCEDRSYSITRYTTTWQRNMNKQRRKDQSRGSKGLKNVQPFSDDLSKITEEFPLNNLAIMTLQWGRQPTVVTVEDYEYPFSQYMSDFGGIVGLWIGLSLISIFEIIEITYKFIQYLRSL